MGEGGAKRAPPQLEVACFLVPLHESVPRSCETFQDYSQDICLHSTPQQRNRTHDVSGLHIRWSTLHGRVCLYAPSVAAGRPQYFTQELVQMSLMHLYAIRCQSNPPCVNKGFRAAHSSHAS